MPSRYGSIKSSHVHFGTADRENHIKGAVSSSSTQSSEIPNMRNEGARFGYFQPHHTQEHYKRKPTTEPQTCLTAKNLNKCNIDNLCLMTAPPIGRQRAKRNRTKLYARIKHSMLTFTSTSVNKNNSFYNSKEQTYTYI